MSSPASAVRVVAGTVARRDDQDLGETACPHSIAPRHIPFQAAKIALCFLPLRCMPSRPDCKWDRGNETPETENPGGFVSGLILLGYYKVRLKAQEGQYDVEGMREP